MPCACPHHSSTGYCWVTLSDPAASPPGLQARVLLRTTPSTAPSHKPLSSGPPMPFSPEPPRCPHCRGASQAERPSQGARPSLSPTPCPVPAPSTAAQGTAGSRYRTQQPRSRACRPVCCCERLHLQHFLKASVEWAADALFSGATPYPHCRGASQAERPGQGAPSSPFQSSPAPPLCLPHLCSAGCCLGHALSQQLFAPGPAGPAVLQLHLQPVCWRRSHSASSLSAFQAGRPSQGACPSLSPTPFPVPAPSRGTGRSGDPARPPAASTPWPSAGS